MRNNIYDLNETFNFGKHSGESVASVIESNPSYIRWCIENVDSFALSATALASAKDDGFYISKELEQLNDNKIEQFFNNDDKAGKYKNYRERNCRSHYGDFAGSYAQDVMGYSDDDIYDAFDGEPDAYWNID